MKAEMEKALKHYEDQFGDVPTWYRMLKLTEEFGELAQAVSRMIEQREGDWLPEIEAEAQDVILSLYWLLADIDGVDDNIETLVSNGLEKFNSREWPGYKKWER